MGKFKGLEASLAVENYLRTDPASHGHPNNHRNQAARGVFVGAAAKLSKEAKKKNQRKAKKCYVPVFVPAARRSTAAEPLRAVSPVVC
jgi:hypothetical protein